ncbi:putative mitochondrial protein [Andalucia godoyi]|uniref:Putative mitochondrial protein n=1 Tax=Andalucia godoyi TaxID=505711 RepID=A0A8K0AIA4_ANDGO|nr:putative mitochondrial protein [Andalucia godoyi]|eukprot:ANDGO_01034.mRNA.1 putative mitochondrial protein
MLPALKLLRVIESRPILPNRFFATTASSTSVPNSGGGGGPAFEPLDLSGNTNGPAKGYSTTRGFKKFEPASDMPTGTASTGGQHSSDEYLKRRYTPASTDAGKDAFDEPGSVEEAWNNAKHGMSQREKGNYVYDNPYQDTASLASANREKGGTQSQDFADRGIQEAEDYRDGPTDPSLNPAAKYAQTHDRVKAQQSISKGEESFYKAEDFPPIPKHSASYDHRSLWDKIKDAVRPSA